MKCLVIVHVGMGSVLGHIVKAVQRITCAVGATKLQSLGIVLDRHANRVNVNDVIAQVVLFAVCIQIVAVITVNIMAIQGIGVFHARKLGVVRIADVMRKIWRTHQCVLFALLAVLR